MPHGADPASRHGIAPIIVVVSKNAPTPQRLSRPCSRPYLGNFKLYCAMDSVSYRLPAGVVVAITHRAFDPGDIAEGGLLRGQLPQAFLRSFIDAVGGFALAARFERVRRTGANGTVHWNAADIHQPGFFLCGLAYAHGTINPATIPHAGLTKPCQAPPIPPPLSRKPTHLTLLPCL